MKAALFFVCIALVCPLVRAEEKPPFSGALQTDIDNTTAGKRDEAKHKRLYAGFRAGGAKHTYRLNTAHPAAVSSPLVYEAALTLDLRLSPLWSITGEAAYTYDHFRADSSFFSTELRAKSFVFPLFAKAVFHPASFYLSVFAGPYMRVPFGPLEINYNGISEEYAFSGTPGIALGGEAGIYTGPGILVLDMRYAQDFFYVSANGSKQYRTGSFTFSLGYKMGFLLTDY